MWGFHLSFKLLVVQKILKNDFGLWEIKFFFFPTFYRFNDLSQSSQPQQCTFLQTQDT